MHGPVKIPVHSRTTLFQGITIIRYSLFLLFFFISTLPNKEACHA